MCPSSSAVYPSSSALYPSSSTSSSSNGAVVGTPTPTPATTYVARGTITLVGVASPLSNSQETSLKGLFVDQLNINASLCGTSTARKCTAADTVLTYSRRDTSVTTTVTTNSESAASTAAPILQTYVTSSGFVTDLQAAGIN